MRRTADTDLVAGALALAYRYAGLPELRAGLAAETDLVDSLEKAGALSAPRAESLSARRGSPASSGTRRSTA